MTATEAINQMFKIHMKAEDDLRDVLAQYNHVNGTNIPVERLCYDAAVESGRRDTIPRCVFGHYYPVAEWLDSCRYYQGKDREAAAEKQDQTVDKIADLFGG